MKRECFFKCYAQGEWWYVYGIDYGHLGVRYRIYKGRRWFVHVTFESVAHAIVTTVNCVTMGMKDCEFHLRKEL